MSKHRDELLERLHGTSAVTKWPNITISLGLHVGLHPIAGRPQVNHALTMKQNKSFLQEKQNSLSSGPSMAALWLLQNATAFAPSADHRARKVGRSFVNQALQPFRDVQRWLAAEAKLIAEHNLLRARSIYQRNY